MAEDAAVPIRSTSLYYPIFQNIFEVADITSCLWQPALKFVGRTHLEFAGLQARQTRAWVHWTHQVMRPATPADFFNANAQLWSAMVQDYFDAAPRMVAAVETAAESVAPEIHQLQPAAPRDTLILLDRAPDDLPERKVA